MVKPPDSFVCPSCHQGFSHDAALRDHWRTSFCGVDPVTGKPRTLTFLGVPVVTDPNALPGYMMPASFKELEEQIAKNLIYGSGAKSPPIKDPVEQTIERFTYEIRRLETKISSQDAVIKDLEIKMKKMPSWDVERYGPKEKIDYAQWFSDEEDGLEEDYRGWPKPKDRIVF